MPNWCEGELKVRGTKENLLTFVLNGLHPVNRRGDRLERLSINEFGDVHSKETCWIENTRRGFVKGVQVYLPEYETEEKIVIFFDAKFAWGIDAEQLLEVCNKYQVDMKIHAFECGMQINQVIEIVDGNILQDNVLIFDDYDWECIHANYGG